MISSTIKASNQLAKYSLEQNDVLVQRLFEFMDAHPIVLEEDENERLQLINQQMEAQKEEARAIMAKVAQAFKEKMELNRKIEIKGKYSNAIREKMEGRQKRSDEEALQK